MPDDAPGSPLSPNRRHLSVEERVALLERIADSSPGPSTSSASSASSSPRTPRRDSSGDLRLREAERRLAMALERCAPLKLRCHSNASVQACVYDAGAFSHTTARAPSARRADAAERLNAQMRLELDSLRERTEGAPGPSSGGLAGADPSDPGDIGSGGGAADALPGGDGAHPAGASSPVPSVVRCAPRALFPSLSCLHALPRAYLCLWKIL